MWRRGAHRHVKAAKEPLIESPSKSSTLRERLSSPWLVIGQYVFNLIMVGLVFFLVANQAEQQQAMEQFSQYLAGKGEQRDAERDAQAERDAAAAERSRLLLCELIAALEADIGGELERISDAAECTDAQGPRPNTDGETVEPSSSNAAESVPIAPGGGTSSGAVTPGSGSATGDVQGVRPGRGGAPSTGTQGPRPPAEPEPEPERPAPPPPAEEEEAGDEGGLVNGVDLCVPLVGCLL